MKETKELAEKVLCHLIARGCNISSPHNIKLAVTSAWVTAKMFNKIGEEYANQKRRNGNVQKKSV